MSRLQLILLYPDRKDSRTALTQIVLPALDGPVGLLPHHATMYFMLTTGDIVISPGHHPIPIKGGMASIKDDICTVCLD